MKKLVYLKKFNEASEEECDFETFKEIMMDLSDYFQCEFHDYTKNLDNGFLENDYFYDCELTIPQITNDDVDEEGTYLTARYLNDILPPTDDPQDVTEFYTELQDSVDNQIENLQKLKNNLDVIISNNNKIKKIFKILEEEIVPRFEHFSNFKLCSIGFDVDIIRISFDMPEPEED
jgi:hypothetical protein